METSTNFLCRNFFARSFKEKLFFKIFLITLFCWQGISEAQVNPAVSATTADHDKQIIGYITEWGPWKDIPGLIPKGSQNQLNVDYSQYTILNFSFFGVAVDGSLHSGDYRNKNIYQDGAVQEPAPLINDDIYSSWDKYLLFGELDVLYYVSEGSYAYNLGYRDAGGGWSNVNTGETGAYPLAVHKEGGAEGLLALCEQNGVKAMASIGGWSMGKHYPEMAADPAKRARFVHDCETLIAMGFDGIDLDWEYPGHEGMNFTGTPADFTNFAILVEEIRAAIGPDKLITSCFTASPSKLNGFDWSRIAQSLDYFNLMTYDYNGGWSNKAGHNAPLYDYPNAEYSGFSVDATAQAAIAAGIPLNKINLGIGFYGRGVVTNGPASLNAPTVKKQVTVQPDGPVSTAADYTNWPMDVWDGTPNYNYIVANTDGWTDHWDDNAKVPYKTKDNYFLSYDNERSIAAKAQYIKDNQLGGVIVWQVAGDWMDLASNTTAKGKLIYSPDTKAPLINTVNEVFADGAISNNKPMVSITSPTDNASFPEASSVSITANATDNDGTVTKVEFFAGSQKLGEDNSAPYSFTWANVEKGSYVLMVKATDNAGATANSTSVSVTITGGTDCVSGKRIVGYMPSWAGTASEIAYSNLTNIIYAFIRPTTTGGLTAVENPQKLRDIVSLAHANNAKVSIAVGGWSDLNNADFQSMAANASNRSNFINNLQNLIAEYQLDGVDIDWEYPREGQDPANFGILMQELGTSLHASGKILTAAVAAQGYYADGIPSSVFNDVDFLNLMAYDGGDGASHSPYSYAESTLDYWLGRGLPADKAVLGVPFYGRPTWKSYSTLVAEGADPYQDIFNGVYYNGINTIKAKAQMAKDRASGIMIWEISQDLHNQYSLLNAINEVITPCGEDNGNVSPQVNITSPANNTVFTAGASVAITASASDSDGSIDHVEFFSDATSIGTDNAAPYSTTWANAPTGTFVLTAKAVDNQGAATLSSGVSIVVEGDGTGCTAPEWNASSIYVKDNEVAYEGNLYKAKWWTQGENPAQRSAPGDVWLLLGPCGGGNGGGANLMPSINLTNPLNGASFTAPAVVNLTANASDADGSISKVEFFNGSTLLATVNSAPYSYSWANVGVGNYTISAKATDNEGGASTSASISISVEGGNAGTCGDIAQYAENGGYAAGSVVQNGGIRYECKPYPYSGWCNGAAWAYAPGSGTYWQDAWTAQGECATIVMSAEAEKAKSISSDTDSRQLSGLKIYPNPSKSGDILHLVMEKGAKIAKIEMVAAKGGKAYAYTFANVGRSFDVKLPYLPQGVYILKVITESNTWIEKYIIE